MNARMSRPIAIIGGTGPAGTGLALRWALLIGLNIRHKGRGGIRITGLPDSAYKINSKLSS